MYRLYGGLETLTLLDISHDERDIIESINEIIFGIQNPRFIIIRNTKGEDEPYRFIYSIEDFLQYVDDYRKRNPDFNKQKKRILKNENNSKLL